jgi:3-oxoacyl-(acyl-carrier-protein) synthase
VIEAPGAARTRGARVLAVAAGWGQAADGHSVAAPHPEGAGLLLAMERAATDAGIGIEKIDHVSAHATSTPVGDRAEAVALTRLFGERGLRPPVAATKGLTGHGLSLAGVMQAALAVLSIDGRFIPGNPHLVSAGPECDSLDLPRSTLGRGPGMILSNSCGFGGSNVCHVIAAPDRITG